MVQKLLFCLHGCFLIAVKFLIIDKWMDALGMTIVSTAIWIMGCNRISKNTDTSETLWKILWNIPQPKYFWFYRQVDNAIKDSLLPVFKKTFMITHHNQTELYAIVKFVDRKLFPQRVASRIENTSNKTWVALFSVFVSISITFSTGFRTGKLNLRVLTTRFSKLL